jgi:alpha-acetolactate decarboxylase
LSGKRKFSFVFISIDWRENAMKTVHSYKLFDIIASLLPLESFQNFKGCAISTSRPENAVMIKKMFKKGFHIIFAKGAVR